MFKGDANAQQHIKNSAHNILFALSRSNLMNRYNSTTHIVQNMTWWRLLYISIMTVTGILTILFSVLSIRTARKSADKVEKAQEIEEKGEETV